MHLTWAHVLIYQHDTLENTWLELLFREGHAGILHM